MTIKRYDPPLEVTDLKKEKLWDWEWCRNTLPGDTEFDFHILEKHVDGYSVHAVTTDVVEAFTIRKQLVADGICQRPFVRARRRVKTYVWSEAPGATEDAFRDAMNSGDDSHIAPEQRAAYDKWAARVITERSAYARVNRDAPRWSNR